jgi:hypothetical protein
LNHKTYTFVHEIPPKKIRKTIVDEYETSETHRLSMSELQRLVLLQQHKILNLKEQKLLHAKQHEYENVSEQVAVYFKL